MISLTSLFCAVPLKEMATLLPVLLGVSVSTNPTVWFGDGCFWERQYAYVQVELDPSGPFKRSNRTITSVVGYAGSKNAGPGGHVCYDNGGPTDYGDLGHCETVAVSLDLGKEKEQFGALVKDFFDSFTPTEQGFARPDTPPNLPFGGDQGPSYRSVVGLPGGIHGPLFPILRAANAPRGPKNLTMKLEADMHGNGTQDEFNTVYVMDSSVFPFFRAEKYHQFHSNFFHNPKQPKSDDNGHYPDNYVKDLYQLQISLGRIADTGSAV